MPHIKIDTDKCKSCGICIEACPNKLLTFDTTPNNQGVLPVKFNSSEKCTGCALCAISCPEIAIYEVKR